MSNAPLRGTRVLELGTILMVPYAAQWLADLGADVIKIEAPAGDSTRYTGPALERGMSSIFLGSNRGKRSVVLDLKTGPGRAALLALVDGADVLIHNNRPQKMAALGLGPDRLLERNPRLVYATLHGFGEAGPYGGRAAYDDVIQGMSGLVHMAGRRTGTPDFVPTVVADKTSGLVGVIGILAALSERDRTGRGGHVEIPMFETMVAYTAVEHLYGHHFTPPRGPAEYPRVTTPERKPFRTRDGFLCALPYTDRHWRAFFEAVGRPDLLADQRFRDITARTRNVAALYAQLAAILALRTTAEWVELFERLEIPFANVRSLEELVEDPHLAATGFFRTVETHGGPVRLAGNPVLFDGERPSAGRPPRLGEHTDEVLGEIGLSAEALRVGPDEPAAE
jgi:crotonobetainyl-CoA:carnitine CoA-transferase CaiB-like acyl-CoA transferase